MARFDQLGRVTREGWEAIKHEMGQDFSLPIIGTVLVEERNVYGSVKLYPANKLAHGLLVLSGRSTFTNYDVIACKALGLTVQTTGAEPRQL